jgi:cyclophilin family peptidyl-prolyl cis-trans isomerase
LAKAQKGLGKEHEKVIRPVIAKKEEKTHMKDVYLAVGIVVLIVVALVLLYQFTVKRPLTTAVPPTLPAPTTAPTSEDKAKQWSQPPTMQIDPTKSYEAVIKTEKGDIRIQLYAAKAPNTVNNFVFLARQGFYDGVTFHRVIPGFMAQTGDPTGTGSGGPGYKFANETSPDLKHDSEGIVSMANAGKDTNGSQFFITYAAQSYLDGDYSVFGKVLEGMDVLKALTPRDPSKNPNAPAGDKITTIEIVEK